MNHSRFLPPPVRLSQAFEGETGGDGISRRTFIKRTGGATVATMVAWQVTLMQLRADPNPPSISGSSDEWEYALKCTDDPSDQTPPTWSLTDYGDEFTFGTTALHPHIDPNGYGDDSQVQVTLGANGPAAGDISGSFTVTAKSKVEWTNHWEASLIPPRYAGDTDEGPIEAASSCTVSLVDPKSPVVTVVPNPQIQTKNLSGNLEALALVTPAFNAYGGGAYHDEESGATGTLHLGPFDITTADSTHCYTAGPAQLSWAVVLVRRKNGGPWEVCDSQPDWDNTNVPTP